MSDDDLIRRGDVLDRIGRGGLYTIQERLVAIRALPAVQPRVKPLVWQRGIVDWAIPMPGMKYVALSATPQGSTTSQECWAWWLDGTNVGAGAPDEEAAKAAAQADYEARILSALEPAVQPDAAQCCMCGKKGLSTEEDGGPKCELSDGRWVCSSDCYDVALDIMLKPLEIILKPVAGAAPTVDELAQIIRTVDGNHSLGAGELAERILSALAQKGNSHE
jgi:hypothetical protein